MKALIVAWQDPEIRLWIPVGRLSRQGPLFVFEYTNGATFSKNFRAFPRMSDTSQVYSSSELFPIFANRIMPRSRPEYYSYLKWLGLEDDDPFMLLARSEGVRATDGLQLYPVPERSDGGLYEMHFFCHGIRHLSKSASEEVSKLSPGERLFPMYDIQNNADSFAVALRTGDPAAMIGYAPSFLARDFKALISSDSMGKTIITVEQVNIDAPLQLRLLCKISAPWPGEFQPFSGTLFETLSVPSDT